MRALAALPALVLALLLALAVPVQAAETIRDFAADIVLDRAGTVDVTETITVNAEGLDIRHGIFRDIPTTLRGSDGVVIRAKLTVIEVEMDGAEAEYSLESLGPGFTRIRIGDADTYLTRGAHTFIVHYTMTRMGRTVDGHDELYWNVTGNYWDFPIDRATANITLPEGTKISGLKGFTGVAGSPEQAVAIEQTSDNTASFRATRALRAGEGLTIAAMFPAGTLEQPSGLTALFYWLSDYRGLILPILAVGIVFAYNILTWSAVGRDPPKGTIIPLFHPPKGFSPALVHYVKNWGFKQDGWAAFTASIFDLGVRGLVSIDNTDKTLTVKATGKEPDDPLPRAESELFDYLSRAGTVVVDTANGPKLNAEKRRLTSAIETENRRVYFINNYGQIALGVLIALACLGALVLFDVLAVGWLVGAVAGGIVLGVFSQVFSNAWSRGGAGRFAMIFWVAIIGTNVLGAVGTSMLSDFHVDSGFWAALSIIVISVVFAVLMRAPTIQGRKVMDQIDGFSMYLKTAEQNRLNMTGEPPMTISRFEAILPYAIALGIEKPWSHYFESELARNAVADAPAGYVYSPGWYTGAGFASGDFSNRVSTAVSGMSAAMLAAQPAAASSSGFSGGGGGGFSGGGGGGGGGGGW